MAMDHGKMRPGIKEMTHTIIITTVKQAIAELTDEEYEEYLAEKSKGFEEDYLDVWISDPDTVERTIEEV